MQITKWATPTVCNRARLETFVRKNGLLAKSQSFELSAIFLFNPQAPVAQKIADEVVFRRFQGEGVEFF